MNTKTSQTEDICCPEFNPAPWDDQVLEWTEKPFIRRSVATFFHMPLNFGMVMRKLDKKMKMEGVNIEDNLCLSDHTSRWNMDLYIAVDKVPEGEKSANFSGRFYSKVYEGPYKDTAKWCNNYEELVKTKGWNIDRWFMWYTTCPKCAKKYGKNYVSILSKVE